MVAAHLPRKAAPEALSGVPSLLLLLYIMTRRRQPCCGTDMKSCKIRKATQSDAPIIAAHRVAMFSDMGQVPTAELAAELLTQSTSALAELLREGSYAGWLAVDPNDRVVAGTGVHIKPHLPRISHGGVRVVTASVPLAVNVYTEPEWRGKGIARALMLIVMEWARTQGFDRVVLHASDAGRPLYVSLGFVPTNEMRWFS
jgi:GNAT superfamily N-acetyltransferase